eukprot:m.85958 g.85958  ORF g.85958 m.85958 type:complete len:391 (+) comp13529_c0_seq5:13-1185(+)
MEENDELYLHYFPIQIATIGLLLILGGCFAGLTLGLMGLDTTSLKILTQVGEPKQREYAKKILPLREHGNLLLCTLVLGNVLVNNTLTILLEQVTSGIIAIIASTVAIVMFGEIIPQSVFSRFGLVTGARTVWLTRFFMFLLFPVAWPISKILDKILGAELGTYYNRDELRQLLQNTARHSNLERDEMSALEGALELKRTTVGEVMTLLPHVFMVEAGTVLDGPAIRHIQQSGYSRIPVYDRRPGVVVGLLHVSDLALAAIELPSGPPKTARDLMAVESLIVSFRSVHLDLLLREFRSGRAHVAIVRNLPGENAFTDPVTEDLGMYGEADAAERSNVENAVGIVTLTDVLEVLIGGKIGSDQRYRQSLNRYRRVQDPQAVALTEETPLIA